MSLRIVCVDDSPLCMHGLREVIGNSQHHFAGGFHRVEEWDEFMRANLVDLVIAEVRVAKVDILEHWPAIAERSPNCRLIVFSYDSNPTHIARASAIDAWDYVLKRSPLHRLKASCDSAEQGIRLADSLIQTARQYLTQAKCQTGSLPHPLTKREQQILVHLSLGLSNREISRSLHISLETVKEHVQNVLRKVKASDRTAAAVWAIRNGTPAMLIDSVSLLASNAAAPNAASELVPSDAERPLQHRISS